MSNKLLAQLPRIIAKGRQDADRILATGHFLAVETREWVLPAKDSALLNWIKADKRRRIYEKADVQPNRLIQGGDLLVMTALLAEDAVTPSLQGKLDLIYMDLPFCASDGFGAWPSLPDEAGMPSAIGQFAQSGESESGTVAYLTMLMPRLILARELLSDRGSICMRVGTHMRHYVKEIIDDLFGTQDPGNHNITQGTAGDPVDASRNFGKCRAAVVIFKKSGSDQVLQDNETGFRHALDFEEAFPVRELPESPIQKFSPVERENFAGKDADMDAGCACCSGASHGPTPMLEAIILALTRPDSIVADFFGRSGNTACIAERLGRRWITSDIGRSVCANMRSRLVDQNAEPFLYQEIDNTSENIAKTFSDNPFHEGDVSQIVLLLYGALPLSAEHDPGRNLGQIVNANSKTLVWVESPINLTGLASLSKAIAQRDRLTAVWDKVVVLAWKLESSIDASIAALNDSRLEVLTIPVGLIETLNNKGDAESLRGKVCFVAAPA